MNTHSIYTATLVALLVTSASAAERSKKTAPPPATPPSCDAALKGASGRERYLHPALKLPRRERRLVEEMDSDPLFKSKVMARTHLLFEGQRKAAQRFVTIADPAEVRDAVRLLAPGRKETLKFGEVLVQRLGVSLDVVESENLYAFYADEIRSLLPESLRPASPALDATEFRFASRDLGDLAIFENFDDGRSVSRPHYRESLRQLANGAYQILYAIRGDRPLLKVGLLPMHVNRQPAILIDFVEVDYRHANADEKWVNDDARLALRDTLRFLTERFEADGREVFALVESSASWVQRRLMSGEKFGAPAMYAGQEVHGRYAFLDEAEPGYRLLASRRPPSFAEDEADRFRARVVDPVLEPAMTEEPELRRILAEAIAVRGRAKREQLLFDLARGLMQRPETAKRLQDIFGVPGYPLNPKFLVKKLDQSFPSQHAPARVYSQSFVIDRKVFRFLRKNLNFGQK